MGSPQDLDNPEKGIVCSNQWSAYCKYVYVNYPLYTPETIASDCCMHLFSRCYYSISMKYFYCFTHVYHNI